MHIPFSFSKKLGLYFAICMTLLIPAVTGEYPYIESPTTDQYGRGVLLPVWEP